jgi:hypothetical protein
MTKKQQVKIDGRDLILTNAEKVYFPRNGFTKGEVIKFYSEIADTILPHLRGRPLTLKRYPDGITGEPFYEKNARHAPPWVETFKVPRSEGGGDITYVTTTRRCFGRPILATSRSSSAGDVGVLRWGAVFGLAKSSFSVSTSESVSSRLP